MTEDTWAAVADVTVARVDPVAGLREVRVEVVEAPCCQVVPSKTPGMREPGAGRSRAEKTDSRVSASAALADLVDEAGAAGAAVVVMGSGIFVSEEQQCSRRSSVLRCVKSPEAVE